jgi:phosphate-selective porin OprO and OprP
MAALTASLSAALALAAPASAQADSSPAPQSPPAPAASGWSLSPRGRLQVDAAALSGPPGIDEALGGGVRVRRARFGVDARAPGDLRLRLEADFADGRVDIADATLSFPIAQGLRGTIGQHEYFQGLERVTSSNFTSFLERAAFTSAFGFERRLGVSATWTRGDVRASAGLFTDNLADLDDGRGTGGSGWNDSRSLDGRLVWAPTLPGGGRLHLGASAHWRDQAGLARSGGTTRYSARPATRLADISPVGTPALRVDRETSWGLEAAFVRGPFHAAAEYHSFSPRILPAAATPTYRGGYAEIGWFLTPGDSRGYADGRFDRTRPRGRLGAVQLNLRYDRLDLGARGTPGGGGSQDGYLASLIWIVRPDLRFLLSYAHIVYRDAAVPAADGRRDYAVDMVGTRAQFDF